MLFLGTSSTIKITFSQTPYLVNCNNTIMTQPFQFANGQLAYNADELLELCQQFPVDGTNYLVREDLEKWLFYIGQDDIAQCAASSRQAALEDRQKLEEFLNKCHALSSPETESSVPATPESQDSVAIESDLVETRETQAPAVTETIATKTSESSVSSTPSNQKPSFFRAIARLIVNVLYRNKN